MGLTNFYLAGHSFGAYMIGQYAYRYPQHVKKFVMLSPLGVKFYTKDELKKYDSLDKLKKGKD